MSAQRVLVAGVAGGVGTTTVTALLFSELSARTGPALVDRSGGDLGARLAGGDEVPALDDGLVLHDLGPHARTVLVDSLGATDVFGVIVASTTPAGFAAATRTLVDIRERHGVAGIRRTLVAAVGVFGAHPTGTPVQALENEFGGRSAVVIPRDTALAAGGRIPPTRISGETRRGQRRLATYLNERLHNY